MNKDLNSKDRESTCIRRVVNNIQDGKVQKGSWKKSRTIWGNIAQVFAGFPEQMPENGEWNRMSYTAAMNGFMRPAEQKPGKKKGLIVEKKDIDKSVEVINQVLAILKPNYICFVSAKAHDNIAEKLAYSKNKNKNKSERVVYPACSWWNAKKKDGTTGKGIFREFVAKAVGVNKQ